MLKLAMAVLWPSFVAAIMAEGCFFSLFDPVDLMMVGGYTDLPPIAAYTIGFFFFWIFGALTSVLSLYLVRTEAPSQPPC
jgi:Na+-driven multidrug efflux pump